MSTDRCEEKTDVDDNDDNEKELTIDSIKSTESSLDELQKQLNTIEFNIATKALAVLRFIADHSSRYFHGVKIFPEIKQRDDLKTKTANMLHKYRYYKQQGIHIVE